MADTILSGDITVNYSDDNRWKSLNWSGGASTTYTMNQVYSALQDLFDETGQMDDGTVMSAETPTEYTIGIIDSGDTDPWYVTYELMEHIAGDTALNQRAGALRTSSWTRSGSNTGIIVVPVTAAGSTIVSGDVGQNITGATTGVGTLLEVVSYGATDDYLVIRPDSIAAGHDFTTNSQVITEAGTSHTASQSAAASNSGEQIWANFFTIGTIEDDTHIYFYQGTVDDATRARVSSIADSTQDWWSDGHIDLCIFTKDFTTDTNPIVDDGYVKAFARKGSTQYSTFEASSSTTSGGSNPVPINTSADLDNPTGYKSITFSSGTVDDFTVGNEILGGSSGARGIITQIDGTWDTYTIHYYLIDDPQTDFQTAAEVVTDVDATGSATKNGSAPAAQGPALSTWFTNSGNPPTITVGNTTFDVDDDGTDEYYGITIDCNQNPLSEIYEWLKYITRNGATVDALTYDDAYTDVTEGEQYVGAEAFLEYSGAVGVGTIDEDEDVLQTTSGATGVVISHDTTNKVLLLRDVRGTFDTSNVVTSQDAGAGTITPDTTATNFAPNTQSPFGSFPGGGTFFGARGVLLSDWLTTDENNFSLVDAAGGTYARPQAYSITVTNLVGTDETTTTDDRVTVFRLDGSGGSIDKAEYSSTGAGAIGDNTLIVDGTITTDTPGKTGGGVLRVRDESDNNQNYRIRYDSWDTSTFTLSNIVIASATGATTTTINEGSAFTDAKRGDIVVNNGNGHDGISYVVEVTDASNVIISPAITGQTTGDAIELNALPIAMDTLDDVYVSLIDEYATASTASVSIIYVSTIYYRARVRNVAATDPDGPIKPFEVDSSLAGANSSVQTVRTLDTIYTP